MPEPFYTVQTIVVVIQVSFPIQKSPFVSNFFSVVIYKPCTAYLEISPRMITCGTTGEWYSGCH
jgi:hypothetical protein